MENINQTKTYAEQITQGVDALCAFGKPTRAFVDGEEVTDTATALVDYKGRVGMDAWLRRVVREIANEFIVAFVITRINGEVKLYLRTRCAK